MARCATSAANASSSWRFSRRAIRTFTPLCRIGPSLLVETHSLKAARTRAWANYDIMRHAIDTILLDPEALRRAVREADREMAARAGDRDAAPVYLAGKVSDKSRPLVYHALKNASSTRAKSPART